tara:strand:- start:10689 stop:11048 length:360 start_codon:yes stop_codon:yes gene_type:complete
MSRIGDYIIGEEESGNLQHDPNPQEPDIPDSQGIAIDDSVPIPTHLLERSNLNSRFGHLPFDSMQAGNSFALEGLTEKEFTALRARVSRANKKEAGTFALQTVNKHEDGAVDARVFRIE